MNRNGFLSEEIQIPDCVHEKADMAFAMIHEGKVKQERKKAGAAFYNMRGFAAGAAACVALVATVSAGAAVYHHMSRGAKDLLQAEQAKLDQMAESGLITSLEEVGTDNKMAGVEKVGEQSLQAAQDPSQYAVTSAGVTITPQETICDGRFAYITFEVDGYEFAAGKEPCFEDYSLTVDGENGPLVISSNCFFDDGLVASPEGLPVYSDGSAIDPDVEMPERYVGEDGTLQYIVWFCSMDGDDLIGKTAHLSLNNLGAISKADFEKSIDGVWDFSIPIEGNGTAVTYNAYEALGESGFTVTGFRVTPVSIYVDYEVVAELPENIHHTNGVADFMGVSLADGTELRYLADGGVTGYKDEAHTKAYAQMTFDRVINPKQVTALYFRSFSEEGGDIWYTVELD